MMTINDKPESSRTIPASLKRTQSPSSDPVAKKISKKDE